MRKEPRLIVGMDKAKPGADKTVRQTALLIWGVPTPLRERFKAACAMRGKTMRDVVMDLLQEYCDKKTRTEQ